MNIKSTARADRGEGQRADFLRVLSLRGSVREACERADVSKQTVYRWRKEDAEFAAAWLEAIDTSTERLEEVVYDRAIKSSDLAAIFLLKARRPHMYRDNASVEVSGPGGGPIRISDGELDAKLLAVLEAAALRQGRAAAQLGLPVVEAEVVEAVERDDHHRLEEGQTSRAQHDDDGDGYRALLAGNVPAEEPRVLEFEQE